MTYLGHLGRGGRHGGGRHGGGHRHHGGGGRWRHQGGGWGGPYGGWGYPYEAQVWDPDYCFDVKGNIIPCPVILSKPINGLGSIADAGVATLLATAVVGVLVLARASRA